MNLYSFNKLSWFKLYDNKVQHLGKERSSRKSYDDKTQHFDNDGRLLFMLQQRMSENLFGFNKMSWCEGVYYKISVGREPTKWTVTGLHERFSGGWRITTVVGNR